jgi:cytochrome c-type biogenesis protein CcmE
MKPHRRKRLYGIMAVLLGVGLAASLTIYALGQNVNLYFTPSQLALNPPLDNHIFRLGGMVKKASLVRKPNSLTVNFILTDYQHEIMIEYTGILPALFRDGQGVVIQGKLTTSGKFIADQVLAKHDEKYMPPGLKPNKK